MMEIIYSLLHTSLTIQTKYSQRYVSSITHYMIYDDKENWLPLWRVLSSEFPLGPFNYPLCLSLLGFVRNPLWYPLLNAIRKIQKRKLFTCKTYQALSNRKKMFSFSVFVRDVIVLALTSSRRILKSSEQRGSFRLPEE